MRTIPAPLIESFFDKPTNTITYLVADPATQVNIRTGTLPAAQSNGVGYLQIPVRVRDSG